MTDTPILGRADATRARLEAAAVDAFADKGFHGTTTRDIAAAAGMSSAALYMHFSAKEELLYRMSLAGHQATLRLVREALTSSEDPALALRRLVHDFALHHASDPTTSRVLNYELGALSPEHREEIIAIRRTIENSFRTLLERGVADRDFDSADPRLSTTALLSLGIDIGRWYRVGNRWSPEEIATFYADMALRIVGDDSLAGPGRRSRAKEGRVAEH